MRCNNLRLVLGLGLVRVSSRVRVKVGVSVLVRVSIRTSCVVNFALFSYYRPVIYTRPKSGIIAQRTKTPNNSLRTQFSRWHHHPFHVETLLEHVFAGCQQLTRKARISGTTYKMSLFIRQIMGRGYNTQFLLYPRPLT